VDALEKVLADAESGASEIEERVLELLRGASPEEASALLATLPERLLEVFPQMANLQNLAKELEQFREKDASAGADAAASLRTLLERRIEERRRGAERLSHVLIPLLPRGELLVFTLSKSGTVATVLEDLLRAERRLAVLVAESRPGAEGARMARDLAERGIRARACDDFLLLSLVPPEAVPRRPPGYSGHPVVLVGADAVHPDALVNKVGTRALLDTARRAGVPAFVLASSSKLRKENAPRALGSLFETIPVDDLVILTERGRVERSAPASP
jgi:translation initiation factor 2B subunit (eIF-2B alpha/beta/delta family)